MRWAVRMGLGVGGPSGILERKGEAVDECFPKQARPGGGAFQARHTAGELVLCEPGPLSDKVENPRSHHAAIL